jgi:hypothetical protein
LFANAAVSVHHRSDGSLLLTSPEPLGEYPAAYASGTRARLRWPRGRRLQAHDGNARTSRLHLVSRAFAKRFFFEVVERRGYRAYGAANAAIRLAAQSRYRDELDQ